MHKIKVIGIYWDYSLCTITYSVKTNIKWNACAHHFYEDIIQLIGKILYRKPNSYIMQPQRHNCSTLKMLHNWDDNTRQKQRSITLSYCPKNSVWINKMLRDYNLLNDAKQLRVIVGKWLPVERLNNAERRCASDEDAITTDKRIWRIDRGKGRLGAVADGVRGKRRRWRWRRIGLGFMLFAHVCRMLRVHEAWGYCVSADEWAVARRWEQMALCA